MPRPARGRARAVCRACVLQGLRSAIAQFARGVFEPRPPRRGNAGNIRPVAPTRLATKRDLAQPPRSPQPTPANSRFSAAFTSIRAPGPPRRVPRERIPIRGRERERNLPGPVRRIAPDAREPEERPPRQPLELRRQQRRVGRDDAHARAFAPGAPEQPAQIANGAPRHHSRRPSVPKFVSTSTPTQYPPATRDDVPTPPAMSKHDIPTPAPTCPSATGPPAAPSSASATSPTRAAPPPHVAVVGRIALRNDGDSTSSTPSRGCAAYSTCVAAS